MTYLRQFGAFLYDFLVGDAWELFVGPIVALIAAWGLVRAGVDGGTVGLLLAIAVVGVGAASVVTALRHAD
jgi:hypothetical protein